MADDRTWFHVTTHTYGAWLYGDPRGFRTRHHREHVEGDYKNPPPPGTYAAKYERSKRLLKQDPVRLTQHQQIAGLRDVLRRRAPVHPAAMRVADDAPELPHQRNDR